MTINAGQMLKSVLMLVECGGRLKQNSSGKHCFSGFCQCGHCSQNGCALLLMSKRFEHACGLIFRTGAFYEFVLSQFAHGAIVVKDECTNKVCSLRC